MESKKKQILIDILKALGLFSILTVIFTYPFVLKINNYIPGFHSTDESYGALWNFWWLKYSWKNHILSCQPPVAIPFSSGPCESGYPLWNAINKWLSILTSNIFAYNFQVLTGYLLSGLFAYLLVYYLVKDKKSAVFSGIIYAFCPFHVVRTWQHLGLSMIQWMPLYLLALLKLRDKLSLKNTLFLALSLFFVFSFDLYFAYFMLIVTGLFIIFVFSSNIKNKIKDLSLFQNDFKFIGKLLISSVIVLILISPILWITIKNKVNYNNMRASAHNPYVRPFEDLFSQSAKPLGYLLPASTHPIFGSFTESLVGSKWYGESFTEHTLYLGWIPLIFAFVAFCRWKKNSKLTSASCLLSPMDNLYINFFIFLTITVWLFSQPPWWNFFGLKIYMPSFLMYKILPMFRAYCRFGIVVMLAIAVLAGFGLKLFLERFKNHKIKLAVAALFCGLVLFEFWNYPPFKVIDASKVPAVYYWLKDEPKETIIAEYPLDLNGSNEIYKFYQTVHEKPIINGTTPGTDANTFSKKIARLSELNTARSLMEIGVKYVLVHEDGYLNTELTQDRQELALIAGNPGLKFVRNFPAQECPDENVMCIQKTGPLDVYQIIAD